MDRKAAASMLELAVVLPRSLADEGAARKSTLATVALLLRQAQAGDARASRGLRRLGALPPRLVHHVAVNSPDIAELAGIETQTPVGAISFPRDPFFRAARAAFETGDAVVADVDGTNHRLRGIRAINVAPAELAVEIAGAEHRDVDGRLGIVDPDSDLMRVITRCEAGDTGPAERSRLVAGLLAIEDTVERVRVVDEHLRSGPLTFFVLLATALRSNQPVTADLLMPPSVGRLVGWLRLDQEDAANLDDAASLLLRETDLFSALDRNMALPRALPPALLARFLELPVSERRSLLKRLWRITRHGIGTAHLCVLAWHALEGAPHRNRTAHRLARRLARVCAETADLHLRIARWVTNELARSEAARAWPPGTTLAIAWSHASEILRLLLDTGVPKERIATLAGQMYAYEERLFGQRAVRNDSSHPGNVQYESYVLGCTDLLHRSGVELSEIARATLLAQLLRYTDDGQVAGFQSMLLFRNEERGDLLGGMFARSFDEQSDASFEGILRVPLRTWRDGIVPTADMRWMRIAARHGDCLIRDEEDRRSVEEAARALATAPIDWTSENDRLRFALALHNFTLYDDGLKEQVMSAWSGEVQRVSSLQDPPTRETALEVLAFTAVDIAADTDVDKAVREFGRLCSVLRGAFTGNCKHLDGVIGRMHPRLGSAAARHLDKLLIAGRTT